MRLLQMLPALIVACGGESESKVDAPVNTIDAFMSNDAAPCNALPVPNVDIAQQRVAQEPPTPMGGTVPDGKYRLIADTVYTGVNGLAGPTGLVTARSSDCVAVTCQFIYVDATSVVRDLLTMTITNDDVSIVVTCPAAATTVAKISTTVAATTTVELMLPTGVGVRVFTYELQP